MSDRSIAIRKKTPTRFENGKLTSCAAVGRKRRKETFDFAQKVHGGGAESQLPGSVGIIDTMLEKCSHSVMVDMLSSNKKFNRTVLPAIYKKKLVEYESSHENMIRSVSVYYSGGVAGKKKYRKIYRDSSYKKGFKSKESLRASVNNCPVPRLVPYHKLMEFIKTINLGKIYSVYDNLCDGLDDSQKVHGCYRNLKELLVRLAEFYLSGCSGHTISWFGEEHTFFVSLGGDGAPFGKNDVACAWLVSFLNIEKGVLSSNENYLLFGANCTETCLPVQKFIKMLVADIAVIEQQSFSCTFKTSTGEIRNVNVKFQVSELPNDMKMVAFLCGELSNAAKYFSSFANVSSDNANNLKGTFGRETKCTWQPWNYERRKKDAKCVESFKKKIQKQNIAESTKRSKVTSFISSQKSRQEFEPLIGKLVDRIHVDPLHLKNNACALAHRHILNEVMLLSQLSNSVHTFAQVPKNSPFAIYINVMTKKCYLTRLANKIVKWFDESNGAGKTFDYRFTGKDSRRFLQNFMFLIDAMRPFLKDGTSTCLKFHVIAYMCLLLRDCVSAFTRIHITNEEIDELEKKCRDYYILNCKFLTPHPTAWTLGFIVPAHTKDMKLMYGLGLGLNSMEGREAKHISICRYSKNTNYKKRWEQIFLHEHVSLVWLRERGYNREKPTSTCNLRYIPKRVTSDPNFCYCGLEKEVLSSLGCCFCTDRLRLVIKEKVEKAISG
jgi:hypothetical protein